jgi:ribosome biogenesis GTPase / thiamine phosphate phosphatase
MRQARKQIKHNRQPKQTRQKSWLPANWDDPDAFYDLDVALVERVMPRGERERRQTVLSAALQALKEEPDEDEGDAEELWQVEDKPALRGVVVEVSSSLCRVDLDGRSLMCALRGSLSAEETGYTNVVAVGDDVVVSANGSDQGVVERVLPRRSVLARPDVFRSHLQQVIVANADQLLIVAAWRDPVLWPELIDRYLITARRNNLTPVICVNKVDLAESAAECRAKLQPYLDLGYRVVFASALTGQGIGELRKVLRGHTTVLAGMSGVGKSSLLTAVQPGLQLRVNEVSEDSGEGRHTTTQVTMLKLAMEGFVVDTPGIREFGLSGLRRDDLAGFYPEIAAAAAGCRFGDCSHIHEPGCAVKSAVQQGRLSAMRYHNYQKIYHTLPGRR